MRRQVGDTQGRIRADHVHGALDEVLEFTTISRPVVTLEKLHDRFTDTAISSAAPTRRILFSCRTRSNLA